MITFNDDQIETENYRTCVIPGEHPNFFKAVICYCSKHTVPNFARKTKKIKMFGKIKLTAFKKFNARRKSHHDLRNEHGTDLGFLRMSGC